MANESVHVIITYAKKNITKLHARCTMAVSLPFQYGELHATLCQLQLLFVDCCRTSNAFKSFEEKCGDAYTSVKVMASDAW